jgi:hypothetical protein
MKTFLNVLLTAFVLVLVSGCGGDKDKGMNRPERRHDLPRAAPAEDGK